VKRNLKAGWKKWRRISDRVANIQARIVLTIFYYTVMAPFGLWQALVADKLRLKHPGTESFWLERTTRDRTLDDARAQF